MKHWFFFFLCLDHLFDMVKYSFIRVWKSSAMQRCARGWPRTHHRQKHPPPPLLPHHLFNPCRRSRWTGWRSHVPSLSIARTNRTYQETAAPIASHCTPSREQIFRENLEVQAWGIGSITEAKPFHPGREPDGVAKNRTFPQGHQTTHS